MRTIAWISAATIAVASVLCSMGCQPFTASAEPVDPNTPGDPADPGTPSDTTDFTAFVKSLLNQTSDTTEPVSLDNIEFTFNEDPTAFDDVLSQDGTDSQ